MSAYILDTDHIDALVDAALRLPGVHTGYWHEDQLRMVTSETATETGAMLIAENVASVQYRYPDDDRADLPGPIPTIYPLDYQYRCFPQRALREPVEILKAIASYRYQSCEHPGWETSAAKSFCEALTWRAIAALPGYEDADWAIDAPRLQDAA